MKMVLQLAAKDIGQLTDIEPGPTSPDARARDLRRIRIRAGIITRSGAAS
jgi:hypothetical protein